MRGFLDTADGDRREGAVFRFNFTLPRILEGQKASERPLRFCLKFRTMHVTGSFKIQF